MMNIRYMTIVGVFKVGVLGLTLSACSSGTDGEKTAAGNIARASLLGADNAQNGGQYGEVIVAEGDGGLIVNINVHGLKPGQHGVHIHDTGKCEGPDFKSAGGHWNPAGKAHGFDNPEGAHMGDLFNLDVGEDGKGSLEAAIDGASLKGDSNALLDDDGAAFMIHAGPDDLKTDPSGESGGRIACGVFAAQ